MRTHYCGQVNESLTGRVVPVAGWAQFRTPIKNLYMCGSATHPGGGIMGAPGRLSALEILKDFKGAA